MKVATVFNTKEYRTKSEKRFLALLKKYEGKVYTAGNGCVWYYVVVWTN